MLSNYQEILDGILEVHNDPTTSIDGDFNKIKYQYNHELYGMVFKQVIEFKSDKPCWFINKWSIIKDDFMVKDASLNNLFEMKNRFFKKVIREILYYES